MVSRCPKTIGPRARRSCRVKAGGSHAMLWDLGGPLSLLIEGGGQEGWARSPRHPQRLRPHLQYPLGFNVRSLNKELNGPKMLDVRRSQPILSLEG